jgi:ribonuclease E
MLIDTTQPEETRVVVHNGDRIEEFDYEVDSRKQLKGNIYLAKITRVEPSLQAAFVDYGGNRHGFLPFSEIHPDYYRIPVADRKKLVDAEEAALSDADDDEEVEARGGVPVPDGVPLPDGVETPANGEAMAQDAVAEAALSEADDDEGPEVKQVDTPESVDSVGGDDIEDAERRRAQMLRRYKIQEVIKRRQILLVQVTKEERGNKGAALTTYLSLAGRYCVLMPNTNKGGGISRKISNTNDRRRLKKVLAELEIPKGIAVIVRTAGSQRSKAEIRRDYEYLMRLWNEIRETTFTSKAPALIYEEANLIKRAIRDLYSREMEEIIVDGEEGYKAAKSFMKSLMPSHAKRISLFKDSGSSLFQHYRIERHIEAMHSPMVTLRSGGYIVLNTTEALVAIDVNSGKATRERNIEETALKTNLEAAEEIGKQLRLRDLAGLIVIDFIDMEEMRHNREVERRLKEALRLDRARIQLGRISHFGLLEMSRQRLRPSLFETSNSPCPHCEGTGFIRTTESLALQILRVIEEDALRRGEGALTITVPTELALYLLNQKRPQIIDIETRHGVSVEVIAEDLLPVADILVQRDGERIALPSQLTAEQAASDAASRRGGRRRRVRKRGEGERAEAEPIRESGAEEAVAPVEVEAKGEDDEATKKRRRRGKRGGRRRARGGSAEARAGAADDQQAVGQEPRDRDPDQQPAAAGDGAQPATGEAEAADQSTGAAAPAGEITEDPKPKRRTRSRRRKTAKPDDAPAGLEGDSAGGAERDAADPTPVDQAPATGAPDEAANGAQGAASATAEDSKRKPRSRRPRKRPAQGEQARPAAANGNFGEDTPKSEGEPAMAPAAASATAKAPTKAKTKDLPENGEPPPKAAPHEATPCEAAPHEVTEVKAGGSPEPGKADKDEDRAKRRGWWNRLV